MDKIKIYFFQFIEKVPTFVKSYICHNFTTHPPNISKTIYSWGSSVVDNRVYIMLARGLIPKQPRILRFGVPVFVWCVYRLLVFVY